MTIGLKIALKEMLEGWQNDLPVQWRTMLGNVDLAFNDISDRLLLHHWEPIYPARRQDNFPGAPSEAHILRAFDNLHPDHVRCVLLGQDPYPSPDFATGRAFEAGNVAEWRELNKMFSKSVRVFMQQICAERSNDPTWASSFEDWNRLLQHIEDGSFNLEKPDQLADRWVDQGVLLLNSSFTISRFRKEIDEHQSQGHVKIWSPLIQAILKHYHKSPKPIVFIGYGDVAIQHFRMAGIEGDHVITRVHPADAEAVLKQENPFTLCNQYLKSCGEAPINW